MNKNLLSLLIITVSAGLILAGCGPKKADENTTSTETNGSITITDGPTSAETNGSMTITEESNSTSKVEDEAQALIDQANKAVEDANAQAQDALAQADAALAEVKSATDSK